VSAVPTTQNIQAASYNPYSFNYNNIQLSNYSPYSTLPGSYNYNVNSATVATSTNNSPNSNPVFGYVNANPGYGISTGFATSAAISVKGCKSTLKRNRKLNDPLK
jgi:hypothetical protein